MPLTAAVAAAANRESWALQVEQRAGSIDLGTCVRVSLSGKRSRLRMHDQGVVVDVVPAYQSPADPTGLRLLTPIADEPRWVVQCREGKKVIRRAGEMVVVCL